MPALKWTTPGGKALHSLPLGNGEIGANVWVESNGDIVFYISKSDAWSEQARLLKLGRVRLTLDPALFDAKNYEESLDVATGTMEVKFGKNGSCTSLKIWIDANFPVIRVEVVSDRAVPFQASVELWRTEPRQLNAEELSADLKDAPQPFMEGSDTVLPSQSERVIWFHQNRTSIWPFTIKQQGLEKWEGKGSDPLLGRTFGCVMRGDGLRPSDPQHLKSEEPRKKWNLEIYPHTAVVDRTEEWLVGVEKNIKRVASIPAEQARTSHTEWWKAFWGRSWIRIAGNSDAEKINEAYRLQRYYLACAGRGNFPIKFNGSLFTVEHPPQNPDYRRWGGAYWFQNTRLMYWPMLASGDTEFMRPLFDMFASQLPLARYRTEKYFHHHGAYFGETQLFWGAYRSRDFGWDGAAAANGKIANGFIRWSLNNNLELLALMQGYHDYTGDLRFAKEQLIPMAVEILTFFSEHYPRDEKGLLKLEPGQALETYWGVINNAPDVAGLRYVLDGLLGLPPELASGDVMNVWKKLRGSLPPLTIDVAKQRLLPAEKTGKPANSENPELYAVFPFQLYGVGLPEIELGKNTYTSRINKTTRGWNQDEIQAALLGLAEEAQRGLKNRFAARGFDAIQGKQLFEPPRFPAVWGPNYDWYPDMDHGSVGMIALQYMLVQARAGEIHVLPAWPKDWNVDFKLFLPGGATITGAVQKGKVERLDVLPQTDTRKVIVHGAKDSR